MRKTPRPVAFTKVMRAKTTDHDCVTSITYPDKDTSTTPVQNRKTSAIRYQPLRSAMYTSKRSDFGYIPTKEPIIFIKPEAGKKILLDIEKARHWASLKNLKTTETHQTGRLHTMVSDPVHSQKHH